MEVTCLLWPKYPSTRPPHAAGDPLHSPPAQESEGLIIPSPAGTRGAAFGWGLTPAGSIEGRAVHPDRHRHRASPLQQETDSTVLGCDRAQQHHRSRGDDGPSVRARPCRQDSKLAAPGERSTEVSVNGNQVPELIPGSYAVGRCSGGCSPSLPMCGHSQHRTHAE
ncbi:hypothetical protein NDU88_002133 [Pleurodeles waltl]|uniref:Uncharacterized protein n=1 Tax=Pleurodeles waltl TaxID=8319 RepID=A0AAV7Q5U9_PLEWA|nr:hypothetical protein NDU88_002133 [Pleurodeles waltl]